MFFDHAPEKASKIHNFISCCSLKSAEYCIQPLVDKLLPFWTQQRLAKALLACIKPRNLVSGRPPTPFFAMYARKMAARVTLKRPNTVRFSVRGIQDVTPHDVFKAIDKELSTTKTIKCIAPLENNWYNVSFDNEQHCERIAMQGMFLQDMLIQCERTSIQNSVVVYIKAPYEMADSVVVSALLPYGTVANIRRQYHDFDEGIETGVRSALIKNLKQPIPSYIKIGGFSLPVRHRGQQKTCKICNHPGHFARDCELRGRCFICGNPSHRADWHQQQNDEASESSTPIAYEEDRHIDDPVTEDEGEEKVEEDEERETKGKEGTYIPSDIIIATEPVPNVLEEETPTANEHHDEERPKDITKSSNKKPTRNKPKEKNVQLLKKQHQEQADRTRDEQHGRQHKPRDKGEKSTPEKAKETRKRSGTREHSDISKPPTFWDEAVKENRKRKATDDDEFNHKEDTDSEPNMEEEEIVEDQDPNCDADYVPYIRKGVQRFRRKRGTGAITMERNGPSGSQNSPRGRGRGIRNT